MSQTQTLVADVGGTNTRFALAGPQGLIAGTTRRFSNAEFAGFDAVVQAYLAGVDGPGPDRLCVALAGPVAGGRGVVTNNKTWVFDAGKMAQNMDLHDVQLLNDLGALGYALEDLPAEMSARVVAGTPRGEQALVVGVATGFNVCMTKNGHVFEAELGHASLPHRVMLTLEQHLGDKAQAFHSIETLFSGAGLQRLHKAMSGEDIDPVEISATAPQTIAVFAAVLGVLCRELTYIYMPLAGIYFNGSLARAVLDGDAAQHVARAAGQDEVFAGRFGEVPQFLITEDTAALHGCARFMRLRATCA